MLEHGWNAVVTARNPATVQDIVAAYPDTARALALDVTDRTQVAEVVQQAEARFGAVDVLVNNAGHGYRSAVEEADEAEVDELFGSNFFGPVALIKTVLPGMRARRHGAIVNVSSIAAHRAGPGSGYLLLGSDAVQVVRGVLGAERAELEAWGAISVTTGFPT